MTTRRLVVTTVAVASAIAGALAVHLLNRPVVAADPPGFAKHIQATSLSIVDDAGKPRILLTVVEDKAALILANEAGDVSVQCSADDDLASVKLFYKGAKTPQVLFSTGTSGPYATLLDKDANPRVELHLHPSGLTTIKACDATGQPRSVLGCDSGKGGGVLAVFAADDKLIWSAP